MSVGTQVYPVSGTESGKVSTESTLACAVVFSGGGWKCHGEGGERGCSREKGECAKL